ncbi:hypothetical protein K3495_g6559 [Podosphaera aphanis]|nr:hypothetical protein K3495_g6559 [Podosphaera aphanis]
MAAKDPIPKREDQIFPAMIDAVQPAPQKSTNECVGNQSSENDSARRAAVGRQVEPGVWQESTARSFANPAPLGLSAFALTTFMLSLINIQVCGFHTINLVIALALGYGGLVQLLAGMWEMAVGNTFGATAFSSYGGFWIAYAIINTPGNLGIPIPTAPDALPGAEMGQQVNDLNYAMGYFLTGWFIFTTLLLLCTLRSTVASFALFFTLDIAFLLLTIGHFLPHADGTLPYGWIAAGGYFGLAAAFFAWYNALAGIFNDRYVKTPFQTSMRMKLLHHDCFCLSVTKSINLTTRQ